MANKPFTLLIHGLHMHGVYMRPLTKALAKSGFDSHAPSYRSLTQSIETHAQRLHHWLECHHDGSPINLVGHSLGGLVIRHFLAHYDHQVHRCVSLGTPHKGSICAHYANRLLPPLVRRAYPNALDGRCADVPDGVVFGAIAGSYPMGLGLPILTYHNQRQRHQGHDGTHDGTVYLSETYLPTLSDYLVLPVSHTGLLTNPQVAQEVIHFLEHGKFSQSSPPPT